MNRWLVRICVFLLLGAIVAGVLVHRNARQPVGDFSVQRFESVHPGASRSEVVALIGEPDFAGPQQPEGQEWIYKSHEVFPTHFYGLIIKNDVVVRKYVKPT